MVLAYIKAELRGNLTCSHQTLSVAQMMLSQRSRRALEAAGAEPACCAAASPTVQGIVSLASGKTFVRPRASYLVRRRLSVLFISQLRTKGHHPLNKLNMGTGVRKQKKRTQKSQKP